MEPENPLLDLYFLQATGKAKQKVCLIPTASGDAEDGLSRFYEAFSRYSCEPSHLAFFRKPRPGAIPQWCTVEQWASPKDERAKVFKANVEAEGCMLYDKFHWWSVSCGHNS
jgi:hypothetical protein